MKFAFLIIGNFNYEIDKAAIHNADAQIIGVSSGSLRLFTDKSA